VSAQPTPKHDPRTEPLPKAAQAALDRLNRALRPAAAQ
jgi:hypothetical protein